MFLFPVILKMQKIDVNMFILSIFEISKFMIILRLQYYIYHVKYKTHISLSILSNLIKTINWYLRLVIW